MEETNIKTEFDEVLDYGTVLPPWSNPWIVDQENTYPLDYSAQGMRELFYHVKANQPLITGEDDEIVDPLTIKREVEKEEEEEEEEENQKGENEVLIKKEKKKRGRKKSSNDKAGENKKKKKKKSKEKKGSGLIKSCTTNNKSEKKGNKRKSSGGQKEKEGESKRQKIKGEYSAKKGQRKRQKAEGESKKNGRAKTTCAFIEDQHKRFPTEAKRTKGVIKKEIELMVMTGKEVFCAMRNPTTGVTDLITNVVETKKWLTDVIYQAENGSPALRLYVDDDYGRGIDDSRNTFTGVREKNRPGRPKAEAGRMRGVIKHDDKRIEETLNELKDKQYAVTTSKKINYDKAYLEQRPALTTVTELQAERILKGVEPDRRLKMNDGKNGTYRIPTSNVKMVWVLDGDTVPNTRSKSRINVKSIKIQALPETITMPPLTTPNPPTIKVANDDKLDGALDRLDKLMERLETFSEQKNQASLETTALPDTVLDPTVEGTIKVEPTAMPELTPGMPEDYEVYSTQMSSDDMLKIFNDVEQIDNWMRQWIV